jgi:hypothetical protein
VGETLALALLSAPPPGDSRVTGAVHWLDLPASVPPFYSSVQANANADVTGFAVTAPMLTGRGQLVLRWFSSPPGAGPARVDGDGCTGFSVCRGGDSRITLGPVAIEVIP